MSGGVESETEGLPHLLFVAAVATDPNLVIGGHQEPGTVVVVWAILREG